MHKATTNKYPFQSNFSGILPVQRTKTDLKNQLYFTNRSVPVREDVLTFNK